MLKKARMGYWEVNKSGQTRLTVDKERENAYKSRLSRPLNAVLNSDSSVEVTVDDIGHMPGKQ